MGTEKNNYYSDDIIAEISSKGERVKILKPYVDGNQPQQLLQQQRILQEIYKRINRKRSDIHRLDN